MVAYRASILQLKVRAETQKYRHKKWFANKSIQQASILTNRSGFCRVCRTSKTKIKSMNITFNTDYPSTGMRKLEDGMIPPQSVVVEEGSSPAGQAKVMFVKWLMSLQLPTQSKTCHSKQKET